jgi:hypothetical protein
MFVSLHRLNEEFQKLQTALQVKAKGAPDYRF